MPDTWKVVGALWPTRAYTDTNTFPNQPGEQHSLTQAFSLDPHQRQNWPHWRMTLICLHYVALCSAATILRAHLKATRFIFSMSSRVFTSMLQQRLTLLQCNLFPFFPWLHKHSEFPKALHSRVGVHSRNHGDQWKVAEVMCTNTRPDPS